MRLTQLFLILALTPGLGAQTLLWETQGANFGDLVGEAVAGGVDFDQDGFDDVLIGAPETDAGGMSHSGVVRAISGADGSVLITKIGDATADRFGSAVAVTDDLDGDGHPDFVVGAPDAASGGSEMGMVRAVSGRTGVTLYTVYGATNDDHLGSAVVGRLDWDGDGVGDFAGGAPDGDWGVATPGYVRIVSGATGAGLVTLSSGGLGDDHYGAALATGDVTGDGVQDLVIGAPGDAWNAGLVEVYDGATHALVWSQAGVTGLEFGAAVGVGDITGDGFGDVFVGAPEDDLGPLPVGSVRVYDSPTGIERHVWYGDAIFGRFGASLALIGDVDGDSLTDLAVGAPAPGRVRVFSTGTQAELFRLEESQTSGFGASVARAGDFDGNGTRDLVVGAPKMLVQKGVARVYSGACPGFVAYCTAGTSASGCRAQLSGSGTPSASAPSGFWLTATDVEGSKDGLFFFGANGRQANSWGNGTSFQCVVPPVTRAGLLTGTGTSGACDGSFQQDLNARWTAKPGQNPGPGAVVQAQLWYRDPQNTSNQTTSLSDALELCVLP